MKFPVAILGVTLFAASIYAFSFFLTHLNHTKPAPVPKYREHPHVAAPSMLTPQKFEDALKNLIS